MLAVVAGAAMFMWLPGCGSHIRALSAASLISSASGRVFGGVRPINGAVIQIFAVGVDGAPSTPLISGQSITAHDGGFNVTGMYTCPSASTQVYLTATGGNPDIGAGTSNTSILLMAAMGPCGDLRQDSPLTVNELTTAAFISEAAPFMSAVDRVTAPPGSAQALTDVLTAARQLVNPSSGTAPGMFVPAGYTVPIEKINTLADVLAACVNSAGVSANSRNTCGPLFAASLSSQGSAPANTAMAMLNIATNPAQNVASLFALVPPQSPYGPRLAGVPKDWSLDLQSPITAPKLLPASGTYTTGQEISLNTDDPSVTIYYSIYENNTINFHIYQGPIKLTGSSIVRAIAVAGSLASAPAFGNYVIATPKLAFLSQPATVVAGDAISPAIVVGIEDAGGAVITSATGPVTLTLASASATLSGDTTVNAVDGLATFSNLVVTRPGIGMVLTSSAVGSGSVHSTAFASSAALLASQPSYSVLMGQTGTGTVRLSVPAPTNGLKIKAASSNASVVSVSSSAISVSAGATSARFTYTSLSAGSARVTLNATGYNPAVVAVSSTPIPVQAAQADAFVDSIGLNVHFGFYGSPYTSITPQLLGDIGTLGVRHVRDQMNWQGNSPSRTFYMVHNQLGAADVKTDYILTSIDYPMSQVAAYSSLVNDMEAVEAANEYDASGDTTWAAGIRQQQTSLYNQIHGSAATRNVVVISPSLAQPTLGPVLGDVSAISDVGDSHAYFGGWNPGNAGAGGGNNPAYFMTQARVNNTTQPIWVTETGFWSVPGTYYGGYGVSEAAMATYVPRVELEFWNAGAARTYYYELIDWTTDIHFGLFRMDGTPKPAFGALRSLISVLKDQGTAFQPDTLAYGLTGATANVHSSLFQKRDGTFYLALWVETLSYDVAQQLSIAVPAQTVRLQLGKAPASATAYKIDDAGNLTSAPLTPLQQISLVLTDKVQIIALR